MDFLAMAVAMWDLLIVLLLPFISVVMMFIMAYKILAAAQITIPNWLRKTLKQSKFRTKR